MSERLRRSWKLAATSLIVSALLLGCASTTWAQGELKAGKTPEQAAADWKLPEKYKGYSGTVSPMMGGMAGRLQLLANEMKK